MCLGDSAPGQVMILVETCDMERRDCFRVCASVNFFCDLWVSSSFAVFVFWTGQKRNSASQCFWFSLDSSQPATRVLVSLHARCHRNCTSWPNMCWRVYICGDANNENDNDINMIPSGRSSCSGLKTCARNHFYAFCQQPYQWKSVFPWSVSLNNWADLSSIQVQQPSRWDNPRQNWFDESKKRELKDKIESDKTTIKSSVVREASIYQWEMQSNHSGSAVG